VRAAGRAGAGVSLDNTIRFGPPPQCDWVLLEVDPYFAHHGFVHGAARVWSPDGILLAVASQTARAQLFD
jgi:acyl-CoA thioesterase